MGPPTSGESNPLDANTMLEDGGKLPQGATTAPCLMATWRCKHSKCKATRGACSDPGGHGEWHHMATHNPVIIQQGDRQRQLRPSEAEAIMGLPRGYTQQTAEGTVPDIERLVRLGGGVDTRQLANILRRAAAAPTPHPKEAAGGTIGRPETSVSHHVKPHDEWNTEAIAEWLTAGDLPEGAGADDGTWRRKWQMHGVEDLVKCCVRGFPLRYEGDRSTNVEQANGATCQDNPETTADELRKELEKGRIAGPYNERPLPGFKAVPRGLKEEPTKFRPISMGNMPFGEAVNEGIQKLDSVQLTRTRDIDRKIRQCYERTGQVWMAKADIKAAYRTMPVRPEDWHLQGIKWNNQQYYIDLRMSFGCRSSVDQWLRFADALSWCLDRWGVHALHYVDDFIFIADSEEECQRQVNKFNAICKAWNVGLKQQDDCGPALATPHGPGRPLRPDQHDQENIT